MPRSEQGLFQALEHELKTSKEPLDCNDLFERASVRQHAQTVNRVSDYLGGLWRKGKVLRLPAPRSDNSRSRWMYQWKGSRGAARNDAAMVSPAQAIAAAVGMGTQVVTKPITLDLPGCTITIIPK